MKKKILSVALIAMSLVSFSGMAQKNNSDTLINKEKVENVKGKKADKRGDKKDFKKDYAHKNQKKDNRGNEQRSRS